MNCEEAMVLLGPFLDDELALSECVAVNRHLANCLSCRSELASLKILSESFQQSELYYKLPTGFTPKVIPIHFRRASIRELVRGLISTRSLGWIVAILIATIFQFDSGEHRGRDDLDIAHEVVAAHVRSLLLPQHLSDIDSTDQHVVKPWFEGKINFGADVMDLSKEGFSLLGGRIEYLDGFSSVGLVYKSKQHIINLFQYPAKESDSHEAIGRTVQGFQIFSWTRSGMNYWAISDLNPIEMQKFVKLWR